METLVWTEDKSFRQVKSWYMDLTGKVELVNAILNVTYFLMALSYNEDYSYLFKCMKPG